MNSTSSIAILLSCFLVAASVNAENGTPEERLTPIVATYLDLLMCANTVEEFQADPTLAQGYRNAAFALDDETEQSGWSDDLFNVTLVAVQDSYRELEISDQHTREDWQRRHFTEERCQNQLEVATNYLEQGVPTPDS